MDCCIKFLTISRCWYNFVRENRLIKSCNIFHKICMFQRIASPAYACLKSRDVAPKNIGVIVSYQATIKTIKCEMRAKPFGFILYAWPKIGLHFTEYYSAITCHAYLWNLYQLRQRELLSDNWLQLLERSLRAYTSHKLMGIQSDDMKTVSVLEC